MKKFVVMSLMALSSSVWAANHEVKMLDHGAEGGMIFEPSFVKAEIGDTVTFLPVNKSHWVQSKLVPEGAEKFQSVEDEQFEVKLTHEGVYIYTCPPHRMMNMNGIIQVGEAKNLEKADKMVRELDKRAVENKGRLLKTFENVK